MILNPFELFPRRFCMQECSRVFARVAILSFLSIAIAISALAGGNPDDKAILSRTAEADGVQFHYLTAGRRSAGGVFFYGGAGDSRKWGPVPPLPAQTFYGVGSEFAGVP